MENDLDLHCVRSEFSSISALRNEFLKENHFQIRYDSCHWRGWSDSYLIYDSEVEIGYGSIKGLKKLEDRDTLFEFFIRQPFRKLNECAFMSLIGESKATFIESQSNEPVLTEMLLKKCVNIGSDTILFSEGTDNILDRKETNFRRRTP